MSLDFCPGAEFYGPDGMYPFAGHECARAFALISTDTADCNNNLEVCTCMLSYHSRGDAHLLQYAKASAAAEY